MKRYAVVSGKNIFENCIIETMFLTLWPTYAANLYFLGAGHSCQNTVSGFKGGNTFKWKHWCTMHDRRRTTTDKGRSQQLAMKTLSYKCARS